jgi:hypothetical protein
VTKNLYQGFAVKYHEELVNEVAKWVGVKETKGNQGHEVVMFQKYVDGLAKGEPWCCGFVQYCLGQVETKNRIRTRIFKTEHVLTMWNKTPVSLRSPQPQEGFIVVWNFVGTPSGHCGIISKVHEETIETIEGNTSDAQKVEREGDGVYKRVRRLNPTGNMKIVGFIDPFANLLKEPAAIT